jgi:hypothetical protein
MGRAVGALPIDGLPVGPAVGGAVLPGMPRCGMPPTGGVG